MNSMSHVNGPKYELIGFRYKLYLQKNGSNIKNVSYNINIYMNIYLFTIDKSHQYLFVINVKFQIKEKLKIYIGFNFINWYINLEGSKSQRLYN